jgi:hypothetical protein
VQQETEQANQKALEDRGAAAFAQEQEAQAEKNQELYGEENARAAEAAEKQAALDEDAKNAAEEAEVHRLASESERLAAQDQGYGEQAIGQDQTTEEIEGDQEEIEEETVGEAHGRKHGTRQQHRK